VIEYPDDQQIVSEADKHGLPTEVLVRDLVRIVELLNLRAQGFFSDTSVLAGSMALRCAKSPRFTIYDADFSVGVEAGQNPEDFQRQLAYQDDDLEITPGPMIPHDRGRTAWKFEPITYDPVFTTLAPEDRQFKADVSYRGLVEEGVEVELLVPYDLDLWSETPTVWVMDIHEVIAEKTLGWCKNQLVKHYADLGFIAIASIGRDVLEVNSARARTALDAKLEQMKKLQPAEYAAFDSIDDVIQVLARRPRFDREQWLKLIYIRHHRDRYQEDLLVKAVQTRLVPLLRGEIAS
jgi:hypothetical protein